MSSAAAISPLVPDARVERVGTIASDDLIAAWKRVCGVDVTDELAGHRTISVCRCTESGLVFFDPMLAGSARLYELLRATPSYYRGGKWEHGFAVGLGRRGDRVIDLGCGEGQFIERARAVGLDAEGVDFNEVAVDAARARGLPVTCKAWEVLAQESPRTYDMVVSFQVLEHLSDPRAFLRSACALLRDGGTLVLAVPHAFGWLARTSTPLDLPPHHVLKWSHQSLAYLERIFPLKLERIVVEPLDAIHVRDWAAACLIPATSVREAGRRPSLPMRGLVRALASVAQIPVVRRRIGGTSIVAVFGRLKTAGAERSAPTS